MINPITTQNVKGSLISSFSIFKVYIPLALASRPNHIIGRNHALEIATTGEMGQ